MEAIKEDGKVSGLCDIKWMCHLLRYGDWKRSRSQEEKGQTINSCWCMLKYSLWGKSSEMWTLPPQLDGVKAISLHFSLHPW